MSHNDTYDFPNVPTRPFTRITHHQHAAMQLAPVHAWHSPIVQVIMLRGALDLEHRRTAFEVLFLIFGAMWIIHVYGAIRHIQPVSETLEIGMWTALLALNAAFFPTTSLL